MRDRIGRSVQVRGDSQPITAQLLYPEVPMENVACGDQSSKNASLPILHLLTSVALFSYYVQAEQAAMMDGITPVIFFCANLCKNVASILTASLRMGRSGQTPLRK